jgi:hypothetical protein
MTPPVARHLTETNPANNPANNRAGSTSGRDDPDDTVGLPGYTPGKRVILFIGAILVLTLGVNIWASLRNRNEAKALAERVVDDPLRVRHEWAITDSGLVETATALDGNPVSADLIRRHFVVLLEQRKFFGNFGTKQFKNKPLPGRDSLEKLVPKMVMTRTDIDGGASLTFATTDPETIRELTRWAAALTEERATRASG